MLRWWLVILWLRRLRFYRSRQLSRRLGIDGDASFAQLRRLQQFRGFNAAVLLLLRGLIRRLSHQISQGTGILQAIPVIRSCVRRRGRNELIASPRILKRNRRLRRSGNRHSYGSLRPASLRVGLLLDYLDGLLLRRLNLLWRMHCLSWLRRMHRLNWLQRMHCLNWLRSMHRLNWLRRMHSLNWLRRMHSLNRLRRMHSLNWLRRMHILNRWLHRLYLRNVLYWLSRLDRLRSLTRGLRINGR